MSVPGDARPVPVTVPVEHVPAAATAATRPGAAVGGGRRRPARGGSRSRPKLTGRGCTLLMLVVFFVSCLLAQWLQIGSLTGAGYGAGCLLAVLYARREALLYVAIAPPVIFLGALVAAELATASGSTLLATAEGTVLALAGVWPWL